MLIITRLFQFHYLLFSIFNEIATLIDLKKKITNLFTKISSPALFLAVDWFTINMVSDQG